MSDARRWQPDRRTVLKGGCSDRCRRGRSAGPSGPRRVGGRTAAAEGTTLDTTVVRRSAVNPQGYDVIDAQSPARLEFLDRYNDGRGSSLIFSSAYRPQEMLMPQFADAMVRAIEDVGHGPMTGRSFDFALCTDDNIDTRS